MIKWSELKAAVDKAIAASPCNDLDPEIVYIDFSYANSAADVNIHLDRDSNPVTLTIL